MGQITGNIMSFATAGAQYKQDKAAVDAQRLLQREGNQLEAAKSSLSYTLQSLANQRRLEAGGEQYAAIATNLGRQLDAFTQGNMQQQIQSAEQLGALAVSASAAGQGGGSIERIKRAMTLQQGIQQDRVDTQRDQLVADQSQAAGSAMKNAIMGLDNNNFFAALDYTQYLDPVKPTSWGEALLGGGIAGIALGIPQAGDKMAQMAQKGRIQEGATQYGQVIGNAIEQVATLGMNVTAAAAKTAATPAAAPMTPAPAGFQPYGADRAAAIRNIGTGGVRIGI